MSGLDWLWIPLLALAANGAWFFASSYVRTIKAHWPELSADIRAWGAEAKAIDGSITLPANPTHWMSCCTRCEEASDFLPDQTAAKDWVFTHYDEKHRKGVVRDA